LSQGLYVLQVFDETGQVVKTEKVVKELNPSGNKRKGIIFVEILNTMALYVIDINERNARGKAFKTLLENESTAKLLTMQEYESMEEKVIMQAIRKAEKSAVLSYEEGKKEFSKLRKRLKK
jgi:hypothetical protein